MRRTAYDTRAAAAVLSAAASDLPGIEDFIGNVISSASHAEALPVFCDAAGQQARQRTAAHDEPA